MNILIVYGGKSCEHDISVITGCLAKGLFDGNIISGYFDKNNSCWLVPNNLTPSQHLSYKPKQQIVFAFGKSGVYLLRNKKSKFAPIDVVVNCCHGVNGEDGTISALCQMSCLPCVGSPIYASGIAMDKWLTKCMLRSKRYPTVPGVCLKKGMEEQSYLDLTKSLSFPLIVKPCTLGSSIGVSVCHDETSLMQGLYKAFNYCLNVLVERALTDFVEFNCASMRAENQVVVSNVASPISVSELLTFEEKYITAPSLPRLDMSPNIQSKIAKITKNIYDDFGFEGVIRVDYLMDKTNNKIYVNEINSIPGSLAYGLWQEKYSPLQYGNALVAQAITDYRNKCAFTYTFPSIVLNGGFGKKK